MAELKQWADVRDDEPVSALGSGARQTFDAATGIRTTVTIGKDSSGRTVRTTRTCKVERVEKRVKRAVLARRRWAKFGLARNAGPGPEANITYVSVEEMTLRLGEDQSANKEDADDPLNKLGTKKAVVVCRVCGKTGHWTLQCPERSKMAPAGQDASSLPPTVAATAAGEAGDSGKPGSGKTGVYRPPGAGRGGTGSSMDRDRDEWTVRVTNLSEECTERDLADLFRNFGHTTRIYLARDRNTQLSRGFAFVNYATKEAAEAAIEGLHGHGFDNLILHVDFAKPREERPKQ